MAASNRAKLIGKLHTALKKKYELPPTQPTRPLLEHLLYACLLEDAPTDLADEGLAKCEQDYFDWNEVRVTTATELSQVLSRMPDPIKAATRLKNNLQSVFEEFYTFDLDHLKKENLGKAITKFQKMPAMTPFVLNYTVQHGLGGHAIPIDYSAMVIMLNTGIASQTEAQSGKVPGIERAIPKSKGIEFSALLHQAAVALKKDIKDKTARAVMDGVDKGSSQRLDDWLAAKRSAKRRAIKKKAAEKAAAEEAAKAAIEEAKRQKRAAAAAAKKAAEKAAAKAAAKAAPKVKAKPKPAPKKAAKKTPSKPAAKAKPKRAAKPAPKKKAAAKKKTTKKSAKKPVKKVAKKSAAAKKKTTKKKVATKKTAKKKATKKSAKKSAKKSSNRKLTKRKPR